MLWRQSESFARTFKDVGTLCTFSHSFAAFAYYQGQQYQNVTKTKPDKKNYQTKPNGPKHTGKGRANKYCSIKGLISINTDHKEPKESLKYNKAQTSTKKITKQKYQREKHGFGCLPSLCFPPPVE